MTCLFCGSRLIPPSPLFFNSFALMTFLVANIILGPLCSTRPIAARSRATHLPFHTPSQASCRQWVPAFQPQRPAQQPSPEPLWWSSKRDCCRPVSPVFAGWKRALTSPSDASKLSDSNGVESFSTASVIFCSAAQSVSKYPGAQRRWSGPCFIYRTIQSSAAASVTWACYSQCKFTIT